MIFRQLFERESSTYAYLIAPHPGGEALLLDPVKSELRQYLLRLPNPKQMDVAVPANLACGAA